MNRIVVLNGVLTGKQLEKEAALHTAVTGNYFIIEDADDRFIDFLLNLSPTGRHELRSFLAASSTQNYFLMACMLRFL